MTLTVLIGSFIVAGALCGFVALQRVNRLSREVNSLRRQLRRSGGEEEDGAGAQPSQRPQTRQKRNPWTELEASSVPPEPSVSRPHVPPQAHDNRPSTFIDQLLANFSQHWMIWLGGACVALAGVFLVRYSIDQGLLGPAARIALALLLGCTFHGGAELLRRRHGITHGALAALAGAGSITLYAALLAAMRLYSLISPGVAFALMAFVGLGTMVMARLHGPVLAAFGILGSFLVPMLVSSGGGDIRIALIYAVIVSASALLLMRYVYRPWLWWGFAIGALVWGLLATAGGDGNGSVNLYYTVLAYLVAALPYFDWSLRRETLVPDTSYAPRALLTLPEQQDRHRLALYALLLIGVLLTVADNPDPASPWLLALPFLFLSLSLARWQDQLYWLPWATLLGIAAAWLAARLSLSPEPPLLRQLAGAEQPIFLGYLAAAAAIASGMSLWHLGVTRRPAVFASLATLAPLVMLTLAYLLVTRPEVNGNWGLATAILALAYLATATAALRKLSVDSLTVWLFIGGHFALALGAAMAFRQASLTLALAAQLLSLAWVISRFRLPALGWLLKVVVAVVVLRLTFNPWLPDYPGDVHWSLWTYGGSTLLALASAYVLRAHASLAAWVAGAALHFAVLTLWSELRYQLYGGAVYAREYSFTEAVLSMLLFGSLALVYHYRAGFSESLRRFMRLYAGVLLVLALLSYLGIVLRTLSSDRWVYDVVSVTPLWNLATPAFAGPVLLGALFALCHSGRARRLALAFTGVATLLFISLQIRHFWSGTIRLNVPAVSDGELYTYSAVWLAMAVAAVLGGAWKLGRDVYRAGMLLLTLVVAKLFLVDMAGLDGLLRVASFMGLGISLLTLSFLYQRLGRSWQDEGSADDRV